MFLFSHWYFRLTQPTLYRKSATTTFGLSVKYNGAKHPARASAFWLAPGVLCTARHVVENTLWIWAHPKGGGMIAVKPDNVHIVPSADIAFIRVPELSAPCPATFAEAGPQTPLLMLRTPFGITTVLRAEEPVRAHARYFNAHVDDFRYTQDWMFSQHDNMMVTTHPTIPGDSGSALFDESGNVVGMVIQRVTSAQHRQTPEDGWQHLSFAIPVADILAEAVKLGIPL